MSVDDLMRYAQFHLAGTGMVETADGAQQQLLSSASLLKMRTKRITKHSSEDTMGLGWHLRELPSGGDEGRVLTAQHGGSLGGHCLHIQLVPARDLCFCILTNHSDGAKNASFHWYQTVILPRQARDKHKGNSKKEAFCFAQGRN